jgi:hypothetical protein
MTTMLNTKIELNKDDNLNKNFSLPKSESQIVQLNSIQLPGSKLISTDIEFQELRQISKLYENLSLAQKKKFIASFIYT